jgi:hypothetical protein
MAKYRRRRGYQSAQPHLSQRVEDDVFELDCTRWIDFSEGDAYPRRRRSFELGGNAHPLPTRPEVAFHLCQRARLARRSLSEGGRSRSTFFES